MTNSYPAVRLDAIPTGSPSSALADIISAKSRRREAVRRSRGDRRRHHLHGQRLGVPRRRERERMGKALADRRDAGLPDDQGLHARPRREGGDAAARGIAAPAARPTISTSGRSTSASTTTIPTATSRRAASSRRSTARKRRARSASSASPGTRIPQIHLRMLSYDYPFDACQMPLNGFDAHVPQLRAAGAARAARAAASPPIGMKSLGGDGRAGQEEGGHARRRAALRDEPAGRAPRSPASTR